MSSTAAVEAWLATVALDAARARRQRARGLLPPSAGWNASLTAGSAGRTKEHRGWKQAHTTRRRY